MHEQRKLFFPQSPVHRMYDSSRLLDTISCFLTISTPLWSIASVKTGDETGIDTN